MCLKPVITQQTSIILLLIILYSCGSKDNTNSVSNPISNLFSSNKVDEKKLSTQILEAMKSSFLIQNGDTVRDLIAISDLYATHKNIPLWIDSKGNFTENAIGLFKAMDSLENDGLSKELFGKTAIEKLFNTLKASNENNAQDLALKVEIATSLMAIKSSNAMLHGIYKDTSTVKEFYNTQDSLSVGKIIARLAQSEDSIQYIYQLLRPNIREYALLQNKLKELKQIKSKGGWPIIDNIKDTIAIKKDVGKLIQLRKRLFYEIKVPTDTLSENMSSDLEAAIAKFQYLHDIKITSKLDTSTTNRLSQSVDDKINQIKLNLDRLRWIQKSIPQPFIWVNVPQMELQYLNHDSIGYQMRVVVGRISRPTPTLNAFLSNIVFNPPWSVPETIMKEEIIPGMKRKGGTYLAKRGLKAYLGGREVTNLSAINEKNFKRYSIQQKPGLNSSLGAVKFNMPNRHAIYLHDTPHRGDFKNSYRAYSSGCIRVHHPREFAEYLLQDSNYTKVKIDSLVKNKQTKEKVLSQKIPVHIVYLTTGTDSLGNFKYLRDIYNYDVAFKGKIK